MKRVLLTLLAVVLIVGALGAVGFFGYQYGYRQGASNDHTQLAPGRPDLNPRGIPNLGFDHGFGHRFGMMHRGIGFGFFFPLMFLGRILIWVLIIAVIYWLFTRSGWRLTRETTTTTTVNPSAPGETYTEVQKSDTESK